MERMKRLMVGIATLGMGCLSFWAQPSFAAVISWTDWTSANATSASGAIGSVAVSFSGNLNPAAQFSGAGTNFWASNPTTYTSVPEVDNGPPDSDIIRLTGGTGTGTQTLTFSQAVVDPVMAILSLGQLGIPVNYVFNAAFDVLNVGPGFFDPPPLNGSLTELAGNILQGQEGHGIIQFPGTFTSISWTIPNGEFWHGFQIGIAGPGPGVPEPGGLPLAVLSLACLAIARWQRGRG